MLACDDFHLQWDFGGKIDSTQIIISKENIYTF